MEKFYITGVSGVGKSTVARELNKKGISSFDIDAVEGLCHWVNKETGEKATYYTGIGREWLEAHYYICDVLKLKKILNEQKDKVVVLGLGSNQEEYLDLFDKIFLLHCKKEVFLHRLWTREGENEFAKDKSEQEHILSWYKEFESSMIKKGAIAIDTENPLDSVVDKIIKEIS